jgi:hypothetical protein
MDGTGRCERICKQKATSNWSVSVPSAGPDEAETRDTEL